MPKRTKPARRPKPAHYPVAPEEISVAGAPPPSSEKKPRKKAAPKKTGKKSRKRVPRRTTKAPKAQAPAPPSVQSEQVAASPKPKRAARSETKPRRSRSKAAKTTRRVRRNPAPQIEAAFYQLGSFTEFEFEEEGEVKRFAFEKPPVLAADTAGKLRVVYDPTSVRGAKVPQKVINLHETFNGFSPDRHMAGVFGKKVPGTRAMGVLKALTYFSQKCVDSESCSSPGHYRHAFEAPFPRVLVNPAGLVLIEGGSYEITRAGIIH